MLGFPNYTLLLRIEAIGFPTFGLLLYVSWIEQSQPVLTAGDQMRRLDACVVGAGIGIASGMFRLWAGLEDRGKSNYAYSASLVNVPSACPSSCQGASKCGAVAGLGHLGLP